jgi:hypothetical protein
MKKHSRHSQDEAFQVLIDQRDDLQQRIETHTNYFQNRRSSAVFWGIVGTACFAGDAMVFGGICSALVGLRAIDMTSTFFKTRSAEKQLRTLDADIQKLVIERAKLLPPQGAENNPSDLALKKARDNFNRASQETVEELQSRIAELQKKVDEIDAERASREKPRKINKPKFLPPSNI